MINKIINNNINKKMIYMIINRIINKIMNHIINHIIKCRLDPTQLRQPSQSQNSLIILLIMLLIILLRILLIIFKSFFITLLIELPSLLYRRQTKANQGRPKQTEAPNADECRQRQTKAGEGRRRQTMADKARQRLTQADEGFRPQRKIVVGRRMQMQANVTQYKPPRAWSSLIEGWGRLDCPPSSGSLAQTRNRDQCVFSFLVFFDFFICF